MELIVPREGERVIEERFQVVTRRKVDKGELGAVVELVLPGLVRMDGWNGGRWW